MKMLQAKTNHGSCGMSLIEVLVVAAVIAILVTIVLPQVSGVVRSSQLSTARQQQAELQTALGSWIVASSSGTNGLAGARSLYNQSGSKLVLLSNYLQKSSYESFTSTGEDSLGSEALEAADAYLRFSSWTSSDRQPIVEWVNK